LPVAVDGAKPAVSVIVPAHNASAGMPRLLEALAAQTLDDAYEVIVVDDGSTDATSEHVQRRPWVRYLRSDEQQGSYAARNRGVELARGDVIAFTDADCVPLATWLERGLEALTADVDLVAGRIDFELSERPSVAAIVDSIRFLDQEHYTSLGFGATANLLVRRSAFEKVGSFNASLRSGGDQEFGLRATAAGARIRYASQAIVMHESRDTLRAIARKSYRIGRGLASHRRHASGPLRDAAPSATHVRLYLPRRSVPGWHRLEPGLPAHRRALVRVVDYVAAQLPTALGIVTGTIGDD
jgi:glycosyltransferase involved in cell wall biosynthesis